MPMAAEDIVSLIKQGLPGAEVEMTDLAGDNDHWAAKVIWSGFAELNRVARTRAVYGALGDRMGGELHALQLTCSVPE
mgnify:CR=1 FL=1